MTIFMQFKDYHVYYNSTIALNKEACEQHWKELGNLTISNMLSHSYRRAMVCNANGNLAFPFLKYFSLRFTDN